MATTLAVAFPWGRYHATPWGRNVNEAVIEWPPSPWRLLRALYATWQWRASDLTPQDVHGALGALAVAPSYRLPAHTEAHTRHYLPDIRLGTDKALDGFVVLERDAEVLVRWPVDLQASQRDALARLARKLGYLGRAESICDARLVDGDARDSSEGGWLHPRGEDLAPDPSVPSVRLLVPRAPLELSALIARTTSVRGSGRLTPPGAELVDYDRPQPARPRYEARRSPRRVVTAARMSLATPARPSLRAAVAVGEVLRIACMARFGQRSGGAASALLAGKQTDGTPLTGHRHAHYLSLDSDGDGLLDAVVVWAPGGLPAAEVDAIAAVDRLVGYGHVPDFRPARLALEGLGSIADVAPELSRPARVWRSHTPFAPTRHAKRRQLWEDHVAQQVALELHRRRLPAPQGVQVVSGDWLSHRRHRLRERLADARRAVGVEIAFDDDVSAPLALGALSHFGLGVFTPQR